MSNLIGQQLGNYRLTRLLGSGGFAEVYLGEHMRLNMLAAIKVLHTNLSDEEKALFQREAQVIADLVQPNIIRVLDFDIKGHTPFLVLDYAPNGSLRQRHPKGTPVPLAQVVPYVKQVAAALQYAHDRKLIHRDVKPENMLLGRQNEILLSDFGIAAVAHSTISMNTQTSLGTVPYMAPEQIQAYPRPASDQYALGIVVYQWLSGELPFQGSTAEVIVKHLSIPPASLLTKVPDLPLGVEQVLFTALAKDPKERFASVQAFANAFEQASRRSGSQPHQQILQTQAETVIVQPLSAATAPMVDSPEEPASVQMPIAPTIAVSGSEQTAIATPQQPAQTPPALLPPPPPFINSLPPAPYYAYPPVPSQPYPQAYTPPALMVPPEARQGRHRAALLHGSVFGIILLIAYILIYSPSRYTTIYNDGNIVPYSISAIVLIFLAYFFSALWTSRRTMSISMALMTCLWLSVWMFGIMIAVLWAINSIVSGQEGWSGIIGSSVFVSSVFGGIGAGISAIAGVIGRHGARKAYFQNIVQKTIEEKAIGKANDQH